MKEQDGAIGDRSESGRRIQSTDDEPRPYHRGAHHVREEKTSSDVARGQETKVDEAIEGQGEIDHHKSGDVNQAADQGCQFSYRPKLRCKVGRSVIGLIGICRHAIKVSFGRRSAHPPDDTGVGSYPPTRIVPPDSVSRQQLRARIIRDQLMDVADRHIALEIYPSTPQEITMPQSRSRSEASDWLPG